MSTAIPASDTEITQSVEQHLLPRTDSSNSRFMDYRFMARPRILLMSAAAVVAGFVLATPGAVNWGQLSLAVAGICCFVAASSVLNQVIESGTDLLMRRTADRPVACGRISRTEACIFALALIVSGLLLLSTVNLLTAISSFATMLIYAFVYTPLKRITGFCTTIGAVPGAMPGVLGWFAAGGGVGMESLALFALFFVWQFPHFLAIGWIYRDDYHAAGLRMLPSFSDDGFRAGLIALVYAVAFVPVSCLPRFAGMAGPPYLGAALILSMGYLWLTIRFFTKRSTRRARELMIGSLVCLPVMLICLVYDYLRLMS